MQSSHDEGEVSVLSKFVSDKQNQENDAGKHTKSTYHKV